MDQQSVDSHSHHFCDILGWFPPRATHMPSPASLPHGVISEWGGVFC